MSFVARAIFEHLHPSPRCNSIARITIPFTYRIRILFNTWRHVLISIVARTATIMDTSDCSNLERGNWKKNKFIINWVLHLPCYTDGLNMKWLIILVLFGFFLICDKCIWLPIKIVKYKFCKRAKTNWIISKTIHILLGVFGLLKQQHFQFRQHR